LLINIQETEHQTRFTYLVAVTCFASATTAGCFSVAFFACNFAVFVAAGNSVFAAATVAVATGAAIATAAFSAIGATDVAALVTEDLATFPTLGATTGVVVAVTETGAVAATGIVDGVTFTVVVAGVTGAAAGTAVEVAVCANAVPIAKVAATRVAISLVIIFPFHFCRRQFLRMPITPAFDLLLTRLMKINKTFFGALSLYKNIARRHADIVRYHPPQLARRR
jgi:hypothetical protein